MRRVERADGVLAVRWSAELQLSVFKLLVKESASDEAIHPTVIRS